MKMDYSMMNSLNDQSFKVLRYDAPILISMKIQQQDIIEQQRIVNFSSLDPLDSLFKLHAVFNNNV